MFLPSNLNLTNGSLVPVENKQLSVLLTKRESSAVNHIYCIMFAKEFADEGNKFKCIYLVSDN